MKTVEERLAEAEHQLQVARGLLHAQPALGFAALKRAQAILEEITDELTEANE